MAELLATIIVVAVLMAALVGLRAVAAHQRSGKRYDLTPRRIASSLSLSLLVVALTRAMILSELPTPSAGEEAAMHVANIALFISVGWWLWTLRVDGLESQRVV